jgi:hypothetical protein
MVHRARVSCRVGDQLQGWGRLSASVIGSQPVDEVVAAKAGERDLKAADAS